MLSCQGCMRQCLQTLIGDYAPLSSPLRRTVVTQRSSQSFRRNYSAHPAIDEKDSYTPTRLREPLPHKYTYNRDTPKKIDHTTQRQQWLESRGTTPAHKRNLEPANMRRHLMYLKDPLKLAEDIRRLLRDDDFQSALETVRAASKDVQCTVSWNHVINWQMSKGRLNAAIKTYNEMKKRAQVPDTYTYTILFRGCAEQVDAKQALAKGMAVYYSMLAENAPVRPTTIHLNAVLKMCARAQDMDALFAIAGDMPRDGMRAPNNLTFTTIFNAMRFHAVGDMHGTLTPMQKRQNIEKTIFNARKMWLDITNRWRLGDIFLDEELVCGMGRILLSGSPRDCDDIFSLVEQTMNIRRQLPRIGTPDRDMVEEDNRHQQAKTSRVARKQGHLVEESSVTEEGQESRAAEMEAFSPPLVPSRKTINYAKPGRNTLSLLMQAMLVMRMKAPATKYWEILTIKHGVLPDSENYAAYLRILRVARASTESVELLRSMPHTDLQVKHFRIAIAACARDKLNRNAFANAGKILDLMQQTIENPDLVVLHSYLEVAIEAPAFSGMNSNTESKYALGQQILRALQRLDPSIHNIKSLMNYGENSMFRRPLKSKGVDSQQLFYENAIILWRRMICAYDLCMNKALVERNMYQELTRHRSKLTAWVTRYQHLIAAASKPKRLSAPSEHSNNDALKVHHSEYRSI